MNKTGVLLGLLLLSVPLEAAFAVMYKWIDANGNVVYSQTKPPGGAEEVKKHNYGVTNEESQQQLDDLTDRAADQQRDRDVKSDIAHEQKTRDETIEKNCGIAKSNLTLLTSQARVTLKDADGNDYFLSEEDKQQKTLDAESQVDRYCTD